MPAAWLCACAGMVARQLTFCVCLLYRSAACSACGRGATRFFLQAETCTGISEFRVCMEASGCITLDDFDSDFAELMATLDEIDDQCEFECRECDPGCRSTLWCADYYGCAKCNTSASLWVADGPPFFCLSNCPSGYADSAGVCTQCIGIVEDGECTQITGAGIPAPLRGLPVGWALSTAVALVVVVLGADS